MGVRDGAGADRARALRHPRHPRALRFRHPLPRAARAMNASYEWLKEFVAFDLTPAQLRDLLTARAATVEELVPLREDLRDVVVGRVVEAARHPNADRLWVTKVDAGGAELLDVVCGAPVVEVGARYPFAPAGSVLPG